MIDNMQGYIERHLTKKLQQLLLLFPVVALLGPRQCGKSTLAKSLTYSKPFVYLDLERLSDQHKLIEAELYFNIKSLTKAFDWSRITVRLSVEYTGVSGRH